MTTDKPQTTLTTLERGFAIVHTLMERDGARVTEVADELDLAPSTAHKYLATLRERSYVVKRGDEYHVGMRFLTIGEYAKHRNESYELAIDKTEALADETGERVQFLIEEYGRSIYVHIAAQRSAAVMTDRRIGKRRYLHSSAAGKAILASLPQQRVDEIVDRWGLPAKTEHTITDRGTLEEELETIRSTGVAFNDEESISGLRAIGVPITDEDGDVIGSLSLSGPSNRLIGERYEEELPNQLRAAANEVELTIAYS